MKPRILIVKLSAVGDVVHALPALNALRMKYPEAHLGWVAHPGPANLLEGHPQLNELIILPRRPNQYGGLQGTRSLLRALKGSGGWNQAIDFQGLTKSGIVTWLSGARTRTGFGNQWSRELNRLFMNQRISPDAVPVIQMNLGLLKPLGISEDSPAIAQLHSNADDKHKIESWSQAHGVTSEKFLFLDPFAGWESKLWETEKWIEVAAHMHATRGMRSLVFHGPGERQHAEQLAEKIPSAIVAPETTLREYVALVTAHGAAMVAADTGPMHIAAAAGIPTVAIFGPSDSKRNSPTFTNARYKSLQDFAQPCAATFTRHCKHHEPGKCMSTITANQVSEALEELLSEPGKLD